MLEDLRVDIQKALSRSEKEADGRIATIDRLRETTERLEASHPSLTAAMAQLMDSFIKLGM